MCANSHTPDINWDDLKAFLAVARLGRLTVAARHIGLDHSTLSRRIIALETSLRVPLFERSPGGYKITEAGEKLAAEVQQMESAVIRIQTEMSSKVNSLSGPVRLTIPEGFSSNFLVRRLHLLPQELSDIRIELIADPSIVSLTKREADIAIMMERPTLGPLVSRKLCDYEYGLYCSHDYLRTHEAIGSIADIDRHFIIGYIPDLMPTPAHDYLRNFLPHRDADLQVSNILTQVDATSHGVGIALLPCFIAAHSPQLVRLLPDKISFLRSYFIVTHENPRYRLRTERVKDFIIEQVNANRHAFQPSIGMPLI
ncbi:LysR family transcriptional regulator [Brucella sp. NBRC 12950]|uniref:LysR family transcriptional regulator n=1 Tax=Brucella sp. NBRC 12950 TaxID=2994518 RepID=UPI0024A29D5E|nr:LysR family transcriptional regulator [Brucella sp. NBRC 12950]GLU28059.1 transcriptional regulator [Brucella sp. NBRC 12950]